MLRPIVVILAVGLALSGCIGRGSSEDTAPDPIVAASAPPAPLPPVIEDVREVPAGYAPTAEAGSRCAIEIENCIRYPFTLPRTAVLQITLTWELQTTDLDLFILNGTSGEYQTPTGRDFVSDLSTGETHKGLMGTGNHEIVILVYLTTGDSYTLRAEFLDIEDAGLRLTGPLVPDLPDGVPHKVSFSGCTWIHSNLAVPRSAVEDALPPGYLDWSDSPTFTVFFLTFDCGQAASGDSAAPSRFAITGAFVSPPPEFRVDTIRTYGVMWTSVAGEGDPYLDALVAWGARPILGQIAIDTAGPVANVSAGRVSVAAEGLDLAWTFGQPTAQQNFWGTCASCTWRHFHIKDREIVAVTDMTFFEPEVRNLGTGAETFTARGDADPVFGRTVLGGAGIHGWFAGADLVFDVHHVPLAQALRPGT